MKKSKRAWSKFFKIALFIFFIVTIVCLGIIITFRLCYDGQKRIVDLKHENNPQFYAGNDTAFLLIHGFASGPQEMNFLGNFLKQKGYSVKTILLNGHNENPLQLKDIKWETWEHQVYSEIEFLHQHGYKNIFVIGFSLGGLLALRTSFIPQVDGIIAISPCLFIYNKAFYVAQLQSFMKIFAFCVQFIPRRADRFFPYKGQINRRVIYEEISLDAVYQVLVLADSTEAILSKIKKPLLLIHAKDDKTVDPVSSILISQQVIAPIKKLEILPHGGHLIVLNDARDRVFDLIFSFVSHIDSTGNNYETTNK